jgi:hypothetical protein
MRNLYITLVRKPEGKRPFSIKMDLKERGCGLDSSGLDVVQWWAVMKSVMNLQVS